MRTNEKSNSGEENLTDDAIKEMDHECHRINSVSRNSPTLANEKQYTQAELRQMTAAREQRDLVNDSPLVNMMMELVPRTPVDFRLSLTVQEAQIAIFSSMVPILRVRQTAPVSIIAAKESQMSSLQVGCVQSYFMSEPEMLFALVKALNSQVQGIFNTSMFRQE